MTLKNILKTTALFTLISSSSFSVFADTQKMYGIQGDKLSIITKVPAPSTYSVKGQTYTTKTEDDAKAYTKEGMASYYHLKFNGRRTASGDVYNSTQFTAAHKTLPINSYALVTNLHNNRKVIVRINDRGPFSDKRLIDLSHAAAKEIGLIFQNQMESLNPSLTIEKQILEILRKKFSDKNELQKKLDEVLEMVGLELKNKKKYPHELSGGMRQRVFIAMGICLNPPLLLIDEPTTALEEESKKNNSKINE